MSGHYSQGVEEILGAIEDQFEPNSSDDVRRLTTIIRMAPLDVAAEILDRILMKVRREAIAEPRAP